VPTVSGNISGALFLLAYFEMIFGFSCFGKGTHRAPSPPSKNEVVGRELLKVETCFLVSIMMMIIIGSED